MRDVPINASLRICAFCAHFVLFRNASELLCCSAGLKMPLAQAHPFEPMPVTHEEEMQEVRAEEREKERERGKKKGDSCVRGGTPSVHTAVYVISSIRASSRFRRFATKEVIWFLVRASDLPIFQSVNPPVIYTTS